MCCVFPALLSRPRVLQVIMPFPSGPESWGVCRTGLLVMLLFDSSLLAVTSVSLAFLHSLLSLPASDLWWLRVTHKWSVLPNQQPYLVSLIL